MRARSICVFAVAALAVALLPGRATAFGLSGLAPLKAAATDGIVQASWCGWKCGNPITPQYFRYRPPSLGARCFRSHWGDVACPYSERPPWWRGCWMDRTGRMVCQKGGRYW